MTRIVIANLLIVLAVILLGLAYRLKRQPLARPITAPKRRRRPNPSRFKVVWLGLSIFLSSARYGLVGV